MLALLAAYAFQGGRPSLVAFEHLPSFPPVGRGMTYTFPAIDPGFAWNECIPSWNVKNSHGALIKFEARVIRPDSSSAWYTLGVWSGDGSVRTSVQGQKDGDGEVLTDTLRMAQAGGKLELRAWMTTLSGHPRLSLVSLSFATRGWGIPDRAERSEAWGKLIEVTPRSQMSYPNGNILCSPTSVSMLMKYWADRLQRPDLDSDVPLVEAGAIDAGDPKTGNWPFSMAYAGSFDEFTAYVNRLSSIAEAERLIIAGIPIACSVDYTLLQGKTGPKAGHLVVLIGFTEKGDPIFNDPGWSKDVRQVYRRSDFDKAWLSSQRTVYVVVPNGLKILLAPI